MGLGKLQHALAAFARGRGCDELLRLIPDGLFLLFKRGPVARELGRVLAAQQHVFPLLHLHLEVVGMPAAMRSCSKLWATEVW